MPEELHTPSGYSEFWYVVGDTGAVARARGRGCGAHSAMPEQSHAPNGYWELWCALGDTGAVARARARGCGAH